MYHLLVCGFNQGTSCFYKSFCLLVFGFGAIAIGLTNHSYVGWGLRHNKGSTLPTILNLYPQFKDILSLLLPTYMIIY